QALFQKMTGAGLSLVFPFCRLHSAFPYAFLNSFLHHLLDFIPLDFFMDNPIIALNVRFFNAVRRKSRKNRDRFGMVPRTVFYP
ncbi:hypothetical protein, partial [Hominenteromicrobium sp.]|uniref:hypothetical protein n=1 Tax=Hominenteromicrobium sp. TaxID=3073581 RepID=UPI003A9151B8